MSRTKSSKNKTNKRAADMQHAKAKSQTAEHFVVLFIGTLGIDGAEYLADRILQKIRAKKKAMLEKYGDKL